MIGSVQLTPHSTVISAFAILILGILGLLFNAEHPELVGGEEDPSNPHQVAVTVFIAVLIYAVGSGFRFLLLRLVYSKDIYHRDS